MPDALVSLNTSPVIDPFTGSPGSLTVSPQAVGTGVESPGAAIVYRALIT